MNRIISLVKTQLNMNFGISAFKYKITKEKKKLWEPILIGFAILVGLGPIIGLYTYLMNGIFKAGVALTHPEIVLTIGFVFAQVIILVFGMFYVLGSLYFSQDLETLVPLPLKPYEVMGSKFLVVMVNEYLTALPILIPPLIIYGIGMGQGLFYWIKGVLLILTAPVIPLIIGSIFVMILMRVVNLRKRKDLLTIVGGFFGVALALGLNLFFQRMPNYMGTDYLTNLIASKTGLINEIGQKFPPSIWATLGLSDSSISGIGYMALFITVSIILFAFLLWLSNQVFYKALIAGQEVSRKKKVLSSSDIEGQYKKVSNPLFAIFLREWKLLMRTPIYVINGLTGAIVGPFMIVVMFFAKGTDPEAQMIINTVMNPAFASYVTLGALGLILFTAGINIVASTTVSREGQTFWIAKMIPVSSTVQVLAKFLHGYAISTIGIISTGVVLGVFFKFPISRLIVLLLLGFLGSISLVAFNVLIDVFHPKLKWNSEQEAMKQNMNGGLGMLASLMIIALYAACAVGLITLDAPLWLVFTGVGLLSVLLAIVSLLALAALAKRKYVEIEA